MEVKMQCIRFNETCSRRTDAASDAVDPALAFKSTTAGRWQ